MPRADLISMLQLIGAIPKDLQSVPAKDLEKTVVMRIGNRIRILRLKYGLTQTELGKKIGLQRGNGNISRLEAGGTVPTFRTLSRIAGAFGVDWKDLLKK